MPRPKKAVPGYSKHSASGQAVAYVKRRAVYLGPYNSPESRQRYADLIAGVTSKAADVTKPVPNESISINELCLRYITDRGPKLRTTDGRRTGELDCFTILIRLMREHFGETPAADFDVLRFRALRAAMIEKDWSRKFINKQCGRVRAIFKFGSSWKLVKADVLHSLKTVEALSHGEPGVRETVPRQAVPQADIDACKSRLREALRWP